MSKAQAKSFLQQWLAFFNDAGGRDKFSKTMQYSSRLLAWYYLSKDPKSDIGLRLHNLMKFTSGARRLTRLFKTVNELDAINKALKENPADLALKVGFHLGYAHYWLFDNISFFQKAKFHDFGGLEAAYQGSRGWMLALVCNFLLLGRRLQRLGANAKKLHTERLSTVDFDTRAQLGKELALVNAQRMAAARQLLANMGDFLVCTHMARLTSVGEGALATGGLVSAVMGGYNKWQSINN